MSRYCANCSDLIVREHLYCDKAECYCFWLSNPVNEVISLQDKSIMEMYIDIYRGACSSKRSKILLADLPSCCNIAGIKSFVSKYASASWDQKSDVDRYEELGDNFKYLKYIAHTKYHLRPITCFVNDTKIHRFDVVYDPIKEKESFNVSPMYLFHGSEICNWASILKNGLKCTCPELQAHGAVYGDGVYLSEQLNVALTYAVGRLIIAVCEISSESYNEYKKAGGWCHVIPDTKLVTIRSLISFDRSLNIPSIESALKNIYTSKAVNQCNIDRLVKSKCSKRLANEMLKLIEMGFECSLEDAILICAYGKHTCVVWVENYPRAAPLIYLTHKPLTPTHSITNIGVFVYQDFGAWIATIKLPDILADLIPILLDCTSEPYAASFDEINESVRAMIYL